LTAGPLQHAPRLAAFVAAGLLYALAAAAQLPSETLVLKNGERLDGTAAGISDEGLRWRMSYGGELDIPLQLIERFETRPAAPPTQRAEETALVPAALPAASPADLPEKPTSAEPKLDPAIEPASAEVPPVVTEPLPLVEAWYEATRSTYAFLSGQTSQWTKRFELGGTWVDGNSETSEAYIGGVFERQFDRVFHQLEWNGRHTTAGYEVTQSRWQFNGTTDLAKDKKAKWILFATHRHLLDQLADLNYRGTYASGIGYRFFNEKEKRLIARLGPAATVEKFDPPLGTRVTPDLFAEVEAKWPVYDRTLLEYKGTFTPSLDEIGVFRMTSNYGVLVKLDQKECWAMRVGLRHDHNSQPNPGKKEDDFTTMFSVIYTRDKPKVVAD
jgi:putative salt-induced outer membrane protein YdiY